MKKLKVGILGHSKEARFLLNKFADRQERFEIYRHNTWDNEFVDVGILDILWICKEFKSNRQLKKKIIKLVVEYNPTLCLIAVPVKPFTTLKLQKIIEDLGLKTNFIFVSSSCPSVLIDWNRYVSVFSFLIGWDLDKSLVLVKVHLSELGIKMRSIKGSFNLEINKLLINSSYLLYNYCEQQRKKIFKSYERKNIEVDRETYDNIQFEINEGLIEIQKPNLIIPIIAPDSVVLNQRFLKFLSNSFKLRFLIYSSRLFEEIILRIKNSFELIRLRIKGRVNKLIRSVYKYVYKLSNSVHSKSKQKKL